MPFRTLPVSLVASVVSNNALPEALALFDTRLPSFYPSYLRPYLHFCLRIGAKVEIPRGVALFTSIGRNHNDGLTFLKSQKWSGPRLATLPPRRGEEDYRASHHAAENPSARQSVDCSMQRIEEASSSQFPSHYVLEAV